jgi:hypothetical protein
VVAGGVALPSTAFAAPATSHISNASTITAPGDDGADQDVLNWRPHHYGAGGTKLKDVPTRWLNQCALGFSGNGNDNC